MALKLESETTDKDLDFTYGDCDKFLTEIGEIYSYTEENEFPLNLTCFQEILTARKEEKKWLLMSEEERKVVIMHIMDQTDVVNEKSRFSALRSLLYLSQGAFDECDSVDELLVQSRKNCFLMFEMGVFNLVEEHLLMEINSKQGEVSGAKNPSVSSIENSTEMRIILTLLYTVVETLRKVDENDTEKEKTAQKNFISSLEAPITNDDPLAIVLFNVVTKFCNNSVVAFPIKKVLLLLWKVLLSIVGGLEDLFKLKCEKREQAGLAALAENPIEVVRNMKASAPPTSADLFEGNQPGRRKNRRGMLRELEVTETSDPDPELRSESNGQDTSLSMPTDEVVDGLPSDGDQKLIENGADIQPATPAPGAMTPAPFGNNSSPGSVSSIASKLIELKNERELEDVLQDIHKVKVPHGLPWEPKTRERDIETFLSQARQKFVGFQLYGDLTTVSGLPKPTKESIDTLRKHQYVSLADLQIQQENEINKYPITKKDFDEIPNNPVERLYQSMLPNLPQYMISLLKILLAAAPTSKAKTDPINILADVLPAEIPSSVVQSMRLGIDVNRHREIIVKSISAIILLLLKNFKLNHVYQFEYTSQHLVFANCIPLVLKFFNQNIVAYVTTKNVIPSLEFPQLVVGEKQDLTAETLEPVDIPGAACWRNLFSSINLLRILNKLVKWKHSRTMMLVVFKSSPILKRALKVQHAMLQMYVLKLLKSQTKYLGRAWRKSNMKIMSAIYQKVRHRLSDDWAYGNDIDARPWDFQQEECSLRAQVERFNYRRYKTDSPTIIPKNQDHEPVDNDLHSVLGQKFDLPPEFRKSYDVWLEREVYTTSTDWDQLLSIMTVQ